MHSPRSASPAAPFASGLNFRRLDIFGNLFYGQVGACVVLATCALVTVRGQSETALPTLRGGEAIEQLKQSGGYDSLMAALNAARQENGQLEDPATPEAVGQSAQLLAADGATSDFFGISVAISGDTAVVGAYLDNLGPGRGNAGSAYVFTRSGGVWTQQQQLTALDAGSDDQFGISVAISGDTIVVGADFDDVGANSGQGSAYVFTRSGGVWTQQARLLATGGAVNDHFGISVAIEGETAVVGAHSDDVDHDGVVYPNQGSAYVFTRSGSVWTQRAQFTPEDGRADDFFGNSVAISGETVVVGAFEDSVGANSDQGSAYVFTGSGSDWTQPTQLLATGGAVSDYFGVSVAISGDTIVVGANLDDVGANSNQGAAYVFTRSGGVWTEQTPFLATGGAANDQFGVSVAISGDTIVVGAAFDDVGATTNQGSAYVFGNASAPSDIRILSITKTGSSVLLQGVGVPDATYEIQATSNMAQPFDPDPIEARWRAATGISNSRTRPISRNDFTGSFRRKRTDPFIVRS